jgi:hypothetical protein
MRTKPEAKRISRDSGLSFFPYVSRLEKRYSGIRLRDYDERTLRESLEG